MKILIKEFRQMIKKIIEQELNKIKDMDKGEEETPEEDEKGEELNVDIPDDPFNLKRKKY